MLLRHIDALVELPYLSLLYNPDCMPLDSHTLPSLPLPMSHCPTFKRSRRHSNFDSNRTSFQHAPASCQNTICPERNVSVSRRPLPQSYRSSFSTPSCQQSPSHNAYLSNSLTIALPSNRMPFTSTKERKTPPRGHPSSTHLIRTATLHTALSHSPLGVSGKVQSCHTPLTISVCHITPQTPSIHTVPHEILSPNHS